MKNLLIYLNPEKKFDHETEKYVKIQIENSLDFWRKRDILLVTNFPYEYNGIKAIVVPDNLFFEFEKRASKINAIIYLLENIILTEEAWFHDFEAFQMAPFDMNLDKDFAIADYGWKIKWNTGVFFFKPKALDIFKLLQNGMYEHKGNEEPVLWILYKNNLNNIRDRIQKLNITYNLGMRHIEENMAIADKPIKIIHFHPYRHGLFARFKPYLNDKLNKLIQENR
jgi:hypothetical protein